MGKLILCTGQVAKSPYYFKSTKASIYTIEELCYYIYHNIETISEDLRDPSLVTFIREELGLVSRADFIENLIKNKAGIKDIIVSIFCSADNYDEGEIKSVLSSLEEFYRLTPLQRKKRFADECMRTHQTKEAMKTYIAILNRKESVELTDHEYGDILHNLGVLYVQMGDFEGAANYFLEAYERNQRVISLKQYLYALKFGNKEEQFKHELDRYVNRGDLLEQIKRELYQVQRGEEYTAFYQEIEKLIDFMRAEEMTSFYHLADEIIERLKEKYRAISIG